MKRLPKLIKGFIRLYVVLFIIVWIGVSVFIINDIGETLDLLIHPHLHPSVYRDPLQSDWCVIMAKEDFFSKPKQKRVQMANDFFREHIEPIAQISYIDTVTFKRNFLESATLSLDDAPIVKWIDSDQTLYRNISSHAWHGGIQISKVVFDIDALLLTFYFTSIIAGILYLLFFTVRWIYRGFKG